MARSSGFGRQPFVERDREGEQFLACGIVDHLDINLGPFEGRIVEAFNVIEEIAAYGGMGSDRGRRKAEVLVVLRDFFVDRRVVDGERDKRNFGSLGFFGGKEATVDVIESGCRKLVVIGRDELHPNFLEIESRIAVIRDDDADRDEGVTDVGKPKEVAVAGFSARIYGHGNVFLRVEVEGGIVTRGMHGGSFFAARMRCSQRANQHGENRE